MRKDLKKNYYEGMGRLCQMVPSTWQSILGFQGPFVVGLVSGM